MKLQNENKNINSRKNPYTLKLQLESAFENLQVKENKKFKKIISL